MFTAPSIQGLAQLNGLDGLAALGTLAALPSNFAFTFGRIARSYPAVPMARAELAASFAAPLVASFAAPVHAVRRHGPAAAAARVVARTLAWLAEAAERRSSQWARARQRRLTEHALRQLDRHTLRDIGFTAGEISSVAAEYAGEIEATRARVWREIGSRIV